LEHWQGGQPHHNHLYCSILAQWMIALDGDGQLNVWYAHFKRVGQGSQSVNYG
jgi:hypothetical protein